MLSKFKFQSKEGSIDDFEIGDMLGKGAYGEVYHSVEKNTGKQYAIKIYDRYQMCQAHKIKSVNNEIKIIKKLDHPNLVKLFSVHESVTKIFLVMELVKGVSLADFLKEKRKNRY
jgi:serine/threonine protein kinase